MEQSLIVFPVLVLIKLRPGISNKKENEVLTTQFLRLRPTMLVNSTNCNLRCSYCYCDRSQESLSHIMSKLVLETTIKKFQKEYPDFISFCWHGGEPLFMGLNLFYEICEIEEKYRMSHQIIENRIQTNGTLINQKIAEFFKYFDFKVGISIDGPIWINDKYRIYSNGQGSFHEIMKGIKLLKEKNVEFSVIITATKETVAYPEKVFRFITDNGFKTVKINLCFGDDKFAVDPLSYANFMNEIFDLWFQEDLQDLHISPLIEIVKWFLGGTPKLCHLQGSCYRHVRIDYNGDVLPCDEFFGKDFKLGNILSQSLLEIASSENFEKFFGLVTAISEKCEKCGWLDLCNGGCSRHSFSGNLTKHENEMCESRKTMFRHIESVLKTNVS